MVAADIPEGVHPMMRDARWRGIGQTITIDDRVEESPFARSADK